MASIFELENPAFGNNYRKTTVTTLAASGVQTATAAQLLGGVLVSTATAAFNLTTATGAEICTALDAVNQNVVGISFQFSIVNLGTSTYHITLLAGATGVTVSGDAIVEAGTSSTFRAVVTAANTVVIYKI
jgi:hypothetical protein